MQQTLYPKKILQAQGVTEPENLLRRQALQIDLNERYLTQFAPGSHIILDFGKEMLGGIRILCSGSDLSPVRVRFGESAAECCAELGVGEEFAGNQTSREISQLARRQNATNDHALRDFTVCLPNWSDTPLGNTGFRFVRLDCAGKCAIKSVVCTNTMLSHRVKYRYHGDKELEAIYAVAKRTVDLCAGSGYIWDGIKRDRLMWVGDLAPQVLALTTLYGRTPEVERSIVFAREYAPLPFWMNGTPPYSMWWVIMLKDYLGRTGAEDFIGQQMDYLEKLMVQLAAGTDENGEMDYPGYFLDWPRAGSAEEREGVRAINIMASKAAIYLLEHFGRNAETARKYLANLLKKPIRPTCKVVTALKYLAVGELTEDEKTVLLTGGAEGMSTFMSYYVLKAVYDFDRALAYRMLKEYYGGMLSLGATTFWEDFEPEQLQGTPIDALPQEGTPDCHGDFGKHCYIGFCRSLCHGWSAGIIAFMKECEANTETDEHKTLIADS